MLLTIITLFLLIIKLKLFPTLNNILLRLGEVAIAMTDQYNDVYLSDNDERDDEEKRKEGKKKDR